MAGETVLVTGGTGFIGAHCIIQLQQQGYNVRTTVRSLKREAEVRAMLKVGGADANTPIGFHQADLMNDAGWAEAVIGADYVLHVASPFPPTIPRHEDELIVPARDGALRVLKASRDAGVKRVGGLGLNGKAITGGERTFPPRLPGERRATGAQATRQIGEHGLTHRIRERGIPS